MVSYPFTYGKIPEENNNFKSETLFTNVSNYCSNEENIRSFKTGFKFGIAFFSVTSIILQPRSAFACDDAANNLKSCNDTAFLNSSKVSVNLVHGVTTAVNVGISTKTAYVLKFYNIKTRYFAAGN